MALRGMPAPLPDFDSEAFWNGLKADRLLLPYCAECAHPRWPPGPMCPRCLCDSAEWRDAPGPGRLYSWAIATHPTHPALADQTPYVLALVEFEPGVRLVGNIVD